MRATLVVKSRKRTPSSKSIKVIGVGSVNGTNHSLIRTSACPSSTTTSVATIQHSSHTGSSSTINHSIAVQSDSCVKNGHRTMSSLISNHSSTASSQVIPSSVLLGTSIVNNTNTNVTNRTLQEQLVWHQQQQQTQTQIQQQLAAYQKAIDQQLLIVNSFGTTASANYSSGSNTIISNGLNSTNGGSSSSSSITDLVNQTINFSKNGIYTSNFDSPWPTFGAVIGITSALALGGLYIEQQKSQNQIQNVNQIDNEYVNENSNNDIETSLSSKNVYLLSTETTSDTEMLECNDVDKQLVELKENRQQQQQQPSYRSGNMRLLSTSPSPELVSDNSTDSPSPDTIEYVDEFDNLPETDEPTDCSVCRTHRQGPCRNPWRKWEYCSKKYDGDELRQKCALFSKQHSVCVDQYKDLYSLIELDEIQNYIDYVENDTKESERRCWPNSTPNSTINMNWGDWPDFVSKEGLNYTQVINVNNKTNSTLPLWKRFPESLNPKPVTGYVSIPCTIDDKDNIKEQQNDYILREVWVTDQDGMVLGHEFSKQFLDSVKKKQNRPDDDKEEDIQAIDNKDENRDEDSDRCTCDFKIIPGSTKQVTVHGKYIKKPTIVALHTKEEPVPERARLVYSSKPYCMKQAATGQ